jgi:Tol biopolymer transport system component
VSVYGGYFWVSDRAVLSFRPRDNGVQAVQVDLPTGRETPIPALSEDFQQANASLVSVWRLSPDGRWLVWRYDDNAHAPFWIVSDLEGKRVKRWKLQPSSSMPLWLPDHRRWVETINSPNDVGLQPVVHSLDGPDVKSATITGPFTWALGVTPDGRILTLEWRQNRGSISWYEYSLSSHHVPPVTHSLSTPRTADGILEAELSPDGDRIACFAHYLYLTPLEKLLRRVLPAQIHPHEKMGLWILKRDGSGMRLVGSEDGATASGLLWTPDGKHVSFYDNNILYAVPVD